MVYETAETSFLILRNGGIFQPETLTSPRIRVRQFIWLKRAVMSPKAHILAQHHKKKKRKRRLLSSAEAQSQISVWFECFATLSRATDRTSLLQKKIKNQDIRQNIIPYGHRNWMRACTGCYSLLLADRGNWIPPGKRFTLFMTSPFWWKRQLSVGGFVFICTYIYVSPQIQMINNTLFVLSREAQRVYSMFVL